MGKAGLLGAKVLPGSVPSPEMGCHHCPLQAAALGPEKAGGGDGAGGSLTWFRKVSILRRVGSGTWMVQGRRCVSPSSRKEARLYMAWVSGSLFRSTRPRLCRGTRAAQSGPRLPGTRPGRLGGSGEKSCRAAPFWLM